MDRRRILFPPLGERVWMPECDPQFGRASAGLSRQLHAAYRGVARRKNVRLIAASDFAATGEPDYEHLTAAGHSALAEAIFRSLQEWICSEE